VVATYDRDWQVNFTLRTFAASHQQLLALGVAWRTRLEAFVASELGVFGADPYKVVGLMWQSLGPAPRDDRSAPAVWETRTP